MFIIDGITLEEGLKTLDYLGITKPKSKIENKTQIESNNTEIVLSITYGNKN